jgi:hypothetical protein
MLLDVISFLQPCNWRKNHQDIQLVLDEFQMKIKQNFNGYKPYM